MKIVKVMLVALFVFGMSYGVSVQSVMAVDEVEGDKPKTMETSSNNLGPCPYGGDTPVGPNPGQQK